MAKIIALQTADQLLLHTLREQGYIVIDMYEAHRKRAMVDVYLYTSYHPDAFTSYHSLAESPDMSLDDTADPTPSSTTIMLNITNLEPEQVLLILALRLQENR